MAADLVQVTTTVPSEEVAADVVDALLGSQLAACVQVDGPIRSRYWWDGALEESTEWRCIAKTTADRGRAAVEAIVAVHPYDVPEVLVTPVLDGHAPYLDWVAQRGS